MGTEESQTSRAFLNVSNHSIAEWPREQLDAARALGYGEPLDFPELLPLVSPEWDTHEVESVADHVAQVAIRSGSRAVGLSGEFTLTVALLRRLQAAGLRCFAATTSRQAQVALTDEGLERRSRYTFVRWREYPPSALHRPSEGE